MNNSKRLFRNAINGYNKEDVNGYIMEITKKFSSAEDSYKAEIEKLKKELSEALEKNKTLEEKSLNAAETEKKLSESLNEISLAKERESELLKKIEEEREIYSDLANEYAKATAERAAKANEENNNVLDKPEDDLDKSKLYDEISAKIGSIIINANKNAEDLLNEAERTAHKLKADSEEEATEIKKYVSKLSSELINQINEDMSDSVQNCMKEFSSYIRDFQYTSKNLIDDFEKKYDELSEKMGFYKTALTEGVAEKIKKFEKECTGINKKNDLHN